MIHFADITILLKFLEEIDSNIGREVLVDKKCRFQSPLSLVDLAQSFPWFSPKLAKIQARIPWRSLTRKTQILHADNWS